MVEEAGVMPGVARGLLPGVLYLRVDGLLVRRPEAGARPGPSNVTGTPQAQSLPLTSSVQPLPRIRPQGETNGCDPAEAGKGWIS